MLITNVTVPIDTRYVKVGIMDDAELVVLDFHMIGTSSYWGCTVKAYNDISTHIEYDKDVALSFEINDLDYTFIVENMTDSFDISIFKK